MKIPLLNGLNFAFFGLAIAYSVIFVQNKFISEIASIGFTINPFIPDITNFLLIIGVGSFVIGFIIGLIVELIYEIIVLPFKLGKKLRDKEKKKANLNKKLP